MRVTIITEVTLVKVSNNQLHVGILLHPSPCLPTKLPLNLVHNSINAFANFKKFKKNLINDVVHFYFLKCWITSSPLSNQALGSHVLYMKITGNIYIYTERFVK